MARPGTTSRPAAPTPSGRRSPGLRWDRLLLLAAAAAAFVALLGGGVWFAWSWATAPTSLTLTATPRNARIVLTGGPRGATFTGTARLSARPLEPGTYEVAVTCPGYKTVGARWVLRQGQSQTRAFTLVRLPVAVKLDVKPATAGWTLTTASGTKVRGGTGQWSGPLPVGSYVLRVAAKGTAPLTRTFTADSALTVSAWLDPSGQLVHKLAIFKCVPAPKGVAVSPDGKQVWVTALVTQPSLAAYDPHTGKRLGSVDLGKNGAVEVTFNHDGSRAYASQMQSASVFEIDTRTFRVLRQMKTGSSWTKIVEIAPGEKRLYAANWSGDDVSVLDLASGKLVRRMHTVDTPRGLYPTPDGKRLFVAGFGEQSFVGRIAVIDLATGNSRTIHSVKGGAMRHMVADEARGRLYTSDMGKGCVWVTDMRTLKTRKWVKTDSHPNTIALSPDKKVLFVSCRGANNPKTYYEPGPEWGSVLLFDTTTGKPLDAIVGGNQCTALALSGDGKLLVFSDFMDNRLRTYEIPAYPELAAGGGGSYATHFKALRKPGWSSYFASHEPGGGGGAQD